MKRKLKKQINRTGKCKCAICHEPNILVEHHINGRNIPKPNHPSNLTYICSNCHRLIHEGLIILEGYVMTTKGKELFWHKKEEDNFTGIQTNTHIIHQ